MVFGRLTVVERTSNKGKHVRWVCRCSCGGESISHSYSLTHGLAKSCGCIVVEHIIEVGHKRRTHGEGKANRTIEYSSWNAMRNRCLNPNVEEYPNYGGRGIKICERWNDYRLFLEDMGRRPSTKHTLDRKNVDGDYTPSNCKWSTPTEQQRNRRGTMYVEYEGKKVSVSELGEKSLVGVDLFRSRIQQGWDIERALVTPRSVSWSRAPR